MNGKSSVQIRESFFNAKDVRLNFAESPKSGPSLLLLHGGSARWQDFGGIIPDLAANWHLFMPDFRGHGKSDWAAGHYRLQDYADDIIAFLQRQVREPVFIFGHSLGGMIALLVAAQLPVYVKAVVVGDSPLSAETWYTVIDQSRERFIRWQQLTGGQRSLEDVTAIVQNEWVARNLYYNDPAMMAALLDDFDNMTVGYDMNLVLPLIQCPVLLLQADPSVGGLMSDLEVEQAMALLARPSHVQLKNVNHALQNDQKQPILQAINDYFRSL